MVKVAASQLDTDSIAAACGRHGAPPGGMKMPRL